MFDKDDEGASIGLWVALGVITVVLFGLIGGLVIRQMSHAKAGAKPATAAMAAPAGQVATPSAMAPAAAAASAAVPVTDAEALLDAPISGDLAASVYFAVGSATLPEGAQAELTKVLATLAAAPARKVVLSGFHDASGDPAKNAELAKERAKTVREALKAGGLEASRVALRKPEVTTGDGSSQEARRVEIRLVE